MCSELEETGQEAIMIRYKVQSDILVTRLDLSA
jgi:hypothetical protein